MYCSFLTLKNADRRINESLKMFETRFEAIVFEFRSYGNEIYFLEPLIVLQFLDTANVDYMQRVFIL